MATPLKNIIADFLKTKAGQVKDQEKITALINEHLNDELKKHIHVRGVLNTSLLCQSDSSAATYTFGLEKKKILGHLQKEFPEIQAIQIKTGCL